MRPRFKLLLVALCWAAFAVPPPALSQDKGLGASFITPFPSGDIYNLQVIGDDLAEGLLGGITETFRGDSRLSIHNRTFPINGLMRADFPERIRQLDQSLAKQELHIAIVMLGAWDRVSVRNASGKRLQFGTEPWKQEYAARADQLMKLLKRRNVAVYWIGLPIVRRYDANEDVQMMNDIIRERVYLNGLKYVDAYAGFSDESGAYSAYGPDVSGKIRLLRDGDGVYFTYYGNRKLAHFVERDLRRDLNQAKSNRSIPLAGDEAEQARINPDREQLAEHSRDGSSTGNKSGLPWAASLEGKRSAAAAGGAGEQKADNGKVNLRLVSPNGREEVAALEIVRPAIPASVVALVTRRESADRLSHMGEAVIDQIPGGLMVMSTVALASGPGAGGGKNRLSPTQAPYFRVLYKGERLPPKPGRADDNAWPRPAAPPESAYGPETDPVETGTAETETAPAKKQGSPAKDRR